MTRLQIQLRLTTQSDQTPIAAEVFDAAFMSVWQGTLYVGSAVETASLELGHYAIRAYLPLGRILSQHCTIQPQSPDPLPVELQLPASATKRVYRSAEPRALESLPANDAYTVLAKGIDDLAPNVLDALARSIWLRLWEQAPAAQQWHVVRWFGRRQRVDANLIQYTFTPPSQGRYASKYYLQVGGEQLRWRLLALPPEPMAVAFSALETQQDNAPPLKFLVTHVNQELESLMSYMNSSALDRAKLVAQRLLFGKYENPIEATVGAYYLLRTGSLAERADWARNLARDMTWLPDGAVIYAWHLLKQNPPVLAEAQHWLLQAVSRGLPIYTEGLRLLYDALGMFADLKTPAKASGIDDALAQVKAYAAVADWRTPTLTFPGANPLTPASTLNQAGTMPIGMLADRQYAVSLDGDYLD